MNRSWKARLEVGVQAALLLGALLGCKSMAEKMAAEAADAGTSTTPTVTTPAAPAGDPAYTLRFGTPKSAEDPEVTTFSNELPTGYVGMKLVTSHDKFPMKSVKVVLYDADRSPPKVLTEKESSLGTDNDVFYKSWELPDKGNYEVKVTEVPSGKLVASGRFKLK